MSEQVQEKGAVGALNELRALLTEKDERGIKQIRVTSVLDLVKQALAQPSNGKISTNGKVTVIPSDVMGVVEVADYLGIERTRPTKWLQVGTKFGPDNVPFPEPYRRLLSGPVWLRQQIEPFKPWVESRRRKVKGSSASDNEEGS